MPENNELQLAKEFVIYTNRNLFLTGKAGTGKTTFLKSLATLSGKRMIVTAPTGVAAINARGVTLHSFFQLPFGPIITEKVAGKRIESQMFKHKYSKEKISIIKTLDLLIIDEISMVRADILDAVDEVLRRFKNRLLPFGGVQLLMIGDLQQLPPVVKNEDYTILKPYYDSFYFYRSKAIQESEMITLELKHIYRQKDDTFIRILNEIRNKTLSHQSFQLLNDRYIPGFKPEDKAGYITLTTHNYSAKEINENRLNLIKGKSYTFKADIVGNFSEFAYPADYALELKIGAQVMFIRNDSSHEKRYFNGKIGIISDIDDDFIMVKCKDDETEIATTREKWENIKYTINVDTNEIGEEVLGTFVQYPLRLAWAITIHKSQGLTFEKAVIDAAAAFAHGQTYVALSRCKTLEGLVLSSKITDDAIICDEDVSRFNRELESHQPDYQTLENAKFAFQKELIEELFHYKQLVYRIDKFEKLLKEHSSGFTGNILQKVSAILKSTLPEITSVADQFMKQLLLLSSNDPNYEKNEIILERLKKAGAYFMNFHKVKIIDEIEESSFETDNKEIRKTYREQITEIDEILNIKQQCLSVCINGFTVSDYLNARARAVLVQKERSKTLKIVEKANASKHPELYAKLKEWRKQKAESEDIELYMVLPNKALQIIAEELTATQNHLKTVRGIGKKKFQLYGEELLGIVNEYLKINNLTAPDELPEKITIPKKKGREISFELYLSGKSIQEIAKVQGYAFSTIENHLGTYVESGEIKIGELIDAKTLQEIMNYFKTSPESTLSEAKSAMSDKYSWSQLKLVQKYIAYLKKSNF